MIIILLFTLAYAGLLIFFMVGLWRLRVPQVDPAPVTVIVAMRNEAANLPGLITSLQAQNHPACRFILADDRSTDATPALIADICRRDDRFSAVRQDVIDPTLAGKKAVLTKAIAVATDEILLFTDADCRPEPGWVAGIAACFNPEVDIVQGWSPLIMPDHPRLQKLKNVERAAVAACTAGAAGYDLAITAVGRNLAYRKSLFLAVNGFGRLGAVPSGDDDLQVLRMAPAARQVCFALNPGTFVPSIETHSLKRQYQGEVRRSSKFFYYPNWYKLLTGFVFCYYLALACLILFALTGAAGWRLLVSVLIVKLGAEWLLLDIFCRKTNNKGLMSWFLPAALVHLPYYIYFGLKGTFGSYRWKD